MDPIWIRQSEAPKMLGVSKTFFTNFIKPQLEPITLSSRCIVYDYIDLQKFCGRVKKLGSWAMRGGQECPDTKTLCESSASPTVASGFKATSKEKELDLALDIARGKKTKPS